MLCARVVALRRLLYSYRLGQVAALMGCGQELDSCRIRG